jgi:hypothetical protein
MNRDTRNAAIAAISIMILFGLFAFYLPTIMLAAGKISGILAAFVAVLFIVALFLVFWLRSRAQRRRGQ